MRTLDKKMMGFNPKPQYSGRHLYRGSAVGRITGMFRTILVAILTVVLLVTPNCVSGITKGSLPIPRGKTPMLLSRRSDISPSMTVGNQIPRGGATSVGRKRGGRGSVYQKALNDEIVWLHQQLRRVEQEKRSLKKKLTRRQQIREEITVQKGNGKYKKSTLDKQEEDVLWLANLEQLEKQKDSLLAAKNQLESVKLGYEQKLDALQSDLLKSKSRKDNLEKAFLARVKELETSLQKIRDAAANHNFLNDPDLKRKVDEACQEAIAEFWEEGNRKLLEHEQQLRALHEQELSEERRLATLAVEKQRQKMRALARATAIREKEVAAKMKEIRRESQSKPKTAPSAKPKSLADRKRAETLEREQLKAIREEAERKAKEEEERMWLELEHELELEREKLQRMKQREEEEKRRCELEELERKRLLQQHALDLEERQRQEQERASAAISDGKGDGSSLFGRLFGSRKNHEKTHDMSEPSIASIEFYQRRVMWQPVSLPPKEVVRITGPAEIGR